MKQECIPVGYVPPTHWPSGGCVPYYLSHHAFDVGGCLPRGYLPRGVSAWGCLSGGAMWPIASCIWCWGCLPRGCMLRVSAQGGVCPGGVCPVGVCPGGAMWPTPSCIWCYLYAVLTPTECQHQCSRLYSGGWSCDPSACWDTTPHVNRVTDRCKNITFLQLRLRAVISVFEWCGKIQRNWQKCWKS